MACEKNENLKENEKKNVNNGFGKKNLEKIAEKNFRKKN